MSGAGNVRIMAVCATCNGRGKVKTLNSRYEVEENACPICYGKGKLTVPRKVNP